ncbi:MAG: aminopeptidase P N-terminal domain-containing protein [Bacteroidetes bacterium]|jgi:Xaa-Pro aminopeptidase|nr:aminopeptidase P N-terminal domain-containing protein [Bacteroidota bacterium]
MPKYSISHEFFKENRNKFTGLLPPKSMAIFRAAERMPRNGDQFFPFRQQSDFFYLSGIDFENAFLILFPGCPVKALEEVLFIEAYNPVKATWDGHMLSNQEAIEISGIKSIKFSDQFETVLRELMHYADAVYLNLNEYPKFQSDVADAHQRLALELKNKFPLHSYLRAAPLLEGLRVCKSDQEISLLTKACEITGKAFRRVLSFVKPDCYEYEVQAEIDHEFTINRANGHGYAPIVAGGLNSCVLHYTENDSQLHDGDLLLFDFGAEYANYTADMSRTIPVNGKFSQRQRDCYEAVLRVLKQAIKLYVPGNTIDQINKAVWKMMEKEMIGLGLFTAEAVEKQHPESPLYQKYLMHGVAHHIGLDVHDVGLKHQPLKAGMVLTCEPGIYIKDERIGIRLENDILVTDAEPLDLMRSIPIEIDEIEKIMSNNLYLNL